MGEVMYPAAEVAFLDRYFESPARFGKRSVPEIVDAMKKMRDDRQAMLDKMDKVSGDLDRIFGNLERLEQRGAFR